MSAESERCVKCDWKPTIGDSVLSRHMELSHRSEREELAMTVHEALIGGPAAAWADLLPIQQKNYLRAADAILAAGFTRKSRAEIQAEALMDFRKGLGRRFWFQDPYCHFDTATVSALHRQVEGMLDAEAQRIREGGDRG